MDEGEAISLNQIVVRSGYALWCISLSYWCYIVYMDTVAITFAVTDLLRFSATDPQVK